MHHVIELTDAAYVGERTPLGPAVLVREGGVGRPLRLAEAVQGRGYARFVVALGIEARLAGDLAAARGISLRPEDATPFGLGCARCHVQGCLQRSLPPRGAALQFSPLEQGVTPFRFAG